MATARVLQSGSNITVRESPFSFGCASYINTYPYMHVKFEWGLEILCLLTRERERESNASDGWVAIARTRKISLSVYKITVFRHFSKSSPLVSDRYLAYGSPRKSLKVFFNLTCRELDPIYTQSIGFTVPVPIRRYILLVGGFYFVILFNKTFFVMTIISTRPSTFCMNHAIVDIVHVFV